MNKKKLLTASLLLPMLILVGCAPDSTPNKIDFDSKLDVKTAPGWEIKNASDLLGDEWEFTDQKTSPASFFYSKKDGSCVVSFSSGSVENDTFKNQDELFVSQKLKQDQVDGTGSELLNSSTVAVETTDGSQVEMVESSYVGPNMVLEETSPDAEYNPDAPAPEMIQDGEINTRSALRYFSTKVKNPALVVVNHPSFEGDPSQYPEEIYPILEFTYSCVDKELDSLVWDKVIKNVKIDLQSAPKTEDQLIKELDEK